MFKKYVHPYVQLYYDAPWYTRWIPPTPAGGTSRGNKSMTHLHQICTKSATHLSMQIDNESATHLTLLNLPWQSCTVTIPADEETLSLWWPERPSCWLITLILSLQTLASLDLSSDKFSLRKSFLPRSWAGQLGKASVVSSLSLGLSSGLIV